MPVRLIFRPRAARGLSLVELMVAVLIGLIVLGTGFIMSTDVLTKSSRLGSDSQERSFGELNLSLGNQVKRAGYGLDLSGANSKPSIAGCVFDPATKACAAAGMVMVAGTDSFQCLTTLSRVSDAANASSFWLISTIRPKMSPAGPSIEGNSKRFDAAAPNNVPIDITGCMTDTFYLQPWVELKDQSIAKFTEIQFCEVDTSTDQLTLSAMLPTATCDLVSRPSASLTKIAAIQIKLSATGYGPKPQSLQVKRVVFLPNQPLR
jgi:hypothetical protein